MSHFTHHKSIHPLKRAVLQLLRLSVSVFYAYLLVVMAGFVDLANAIVSCRDVISSQTTYRYNEALSDFRYFENKTYAVALSGVTGKSALPDNFFAFSPNFSYEYTHGGADSVSLKAQLATGKYGVARPVAITSQAVQDFIIEQYGSYLNSGPTLVDAWKEYGIAEPFTAINGGSLPFEPWEAVPVPANSPSAVSMNITGNWAPVSSGTFSRQIVEFEGKLDCAIDLSAPYDPPPPPPVPDADTESLIDLSLYDGLICMADLNLDGELSGPAESAKCSSTTMGDFCPIGALDCNTTFQPPVCPSGSILNTERDMCQKEPEQVNCPTGYTWDQSIDKCVMYPPCPDGGTYNTVTDRCEKLVLNDCPTGYTFDTTLQVCQKAVVCPDGGSFNIFKDRCESPVVWDCPVGYAYNSGEAKCEAPPSCSAGWVYSVTTDRCQIAPNNCPTGYSYNAALDQCVVSATCASGGALNGTSDKCELTAAITCNSGWTYNSGNGKCEQLPTCAAPGSYNSAYNLCMTGSTGTSCPSGYYFSAGQAACVAAPICNSGTYNTNNDRCEATPAYSCPDASYTYNSARAQCEKAPVCPSGMIYNATFNLCTLAITPVCASGYTYNATRGRCEFVPPTCTAGTNYNSATNRCESVPTCSSGTYSAATNNCISGGSYAATAAPGGADVAVYKCMPNAGTLEYPIPYLWSAYTKPGTCAVHSVVGYISSNWFPGGVALAYLNIPSHTAYGQLSPWTGYDSPTEVVVGYMSSQDDLRVGFTVPSTNWFLANDANGGYISASGGYTCPSEGTLSGTTCSTTVYTTATCPSGTALDGAADRWIANPTCVGGSFDGTNDVCYVAFTASCTKGTYDSVSGLCVVAPTCSNGALDGGIDQCYQAKLTGCPSGYSLSGSTCIATPSCTTPGLFTGGTTDLCHTPATYLCPSGYSYSTGTSQCYQTANCNGGGLNTTSDKCEMAFTYACPTTYTVSGSLCQATPACTTGGIYNSSLNLCNSTTGVCSAGILDTSLDVCYQAAGCSGGMLNTTRDKCEAAATPDCGASYSWDSTATVYYSSPVCDLGAFQIMRDRCEASVTRNCGTYSWDSGAQKCLQNVSCPTSTPFTTSLATDIDRCLSVPDHVCSSDLTWNGQPIMQCEAVPICNGAIFYDAVSDQCLISADCPYGNEYACMPNPTSGSLQCSPNQCVNASEGEGVELEPFDESYFQDDGPKDEHGNCLGQIYIFSGKPSRCRPPGWTVGYINDCCADGDLMPENTGSGAATMSGAYDLYKGSRAAYTAYTTYNAVTAATAAGGAQAGFDAGVSAVSAATTASTQTGAMAGANAAVTGASQTGAMANAALDAMGPAIAVYATGAVVEALGGDQDAKLAAQMAVTMMLMSGPQMVIGIVVLVVMRFVMGTGCDANDIMTANNVESKRCHYIGRYCEKTILGMCVQRAKGHCCFNSILARIMHEQGRPMLTSFQPNGDWGPAKRPNCRGFTPAEFQSIDFGKIDMTEYYGEILADIEERIQGASQRVEGTIKGRLEQIQSGASLSNNTSGGTSGN